MFTILTLSQYIAQQRAARGLQMAQDPWGGRQDNQQNDSKGRDQPPDLDELFNKLIGRRNSNSGGNGDNGDNRRGGGSLPPMNFQFNSKLAGLAGAVLLALWLGSGIYTVKERENGVETVLGKYSNTSKSGLNWRVPYPFGRVEIVDVQSISTMRVGEFKTQKGSVSTQDQRVGQMLTKDENIVEIGAAVQYRISDARAFQFNAADPVEVLGDVVTSAIREVVGANTVDDILTDRRNEWPQQARKIIEETIAAYGLGIEVVALELQDARVPVEVQDAFEDAVRAREDEERLRLQAEAFANERLPIARGHAKQQVQAAKAYAAQIEARAAADATRFAALLNAYQQDKAALRSRLYLETMSAVYADNPKVVLEGDATPIINMNGMANDQTEQKLLEQIAAAHQQADQQTGNHSATSNANPQNNSSASSSGNAAAQDERSRLRSRGR